jgi:hypothetical protein
MTRKTPHLFATPAAVFTLSACALAAALFTGAVGAADPAPAAVAAASNGPVKLEPIAGTALKRITLTAKAAQRLDVQTAPVTEQVVVRHQIVSGMVIYPQAGGAKPAAPADAAAAGGGGGGGFGGFTSTPTAVPAKPAGLGMTPVALKATELAPNTKGESRVVVNLSPGELERIAKDKPARITPLYTRDKGVEAMLAPPSGAEPVADGKRAMLSLQYVLPHSNHGMAPSTRVRVELQQAGSDAKQTVVPYSALYYDAKGLPWVYVNPQPLTYHRQRVTVQQVVGPHAVITDGPALGTQVVTVGASLLYGTEIFGK